MSLDVDKVVSYLESNGAQNVRYLPQKNEVRSTCPFHGGANDTALAANLTENYLYCFACGYRQTLSEAIGESINEEAEFVKRSQSKKREIIDYSEVGECVVEEMKLNYGHKDVLYRCNNPEMLEICGIGVATESSYAGRTIFVYRDREQKLHGFKSRYKRIFSVDNYCDYNSVFFMEHLWTGTYPTIIVEGEWDAVRLLELGFIDVLALGGLSLTSERISNLAKKTSTIFLALDNDKAGRLHTMKFAKKLNGLFNVYTLPYKHKDPAMIGSREEFQLCINNKVRL